MRIVALAASRRCLIKPEGEKVIFLTHRLFNIEPIDDVFEVRIFYSCKNKNENWLVRIHAHEIDGGCILDQFEYPPLSDYGDGEVLHELYDKHCKELRRHIKEDLEPCEYVKNDLIRNIRAEESEVRNTLKRFQDVLVTRNSINAIKFLGPNVISFYQTIKEKALILEKQEIQRLGWATKSCILFARHLFSRELLETTKPELIYKKLVEEGYFSDSAKQFEESIVFVKDDYAGVYDENNNKELALFSKNNEEWVCEIDDVSFDLFERDFIRSATDLKIEPESLLRAHWKQITGVELNENLWDPNW